MRRTKILGVVAMLAALMLVGTSPAMAAGVPMKASLEITYQIAGWCSEVPGEIAFVEGIGSGTATVGGDYYDVTVVTEQCSSILAGDPFDPPLLIGKVTDGHMTLTSGANELMLAIEGGFATNSQGSMGYGRWTVEGGSGDFADASGRGAIYLSGEEPYVLDAELMGSLFMP